MRRNPATLEISAVSIAEIAIKHTKGNLRLREDDILAGVGQLNLTILPWTATNGFHLFSVAIHHPDPFDRMLIAQAMTEDMPIVTPDPAFRLYAGLKTIW